MKIHSLTLAGFRCFGSDPTTVFLSDEITALVGANGSGKTALLEALVRVFGMTREQRAIQRTDFHMPPDTPAEGRTPRQLSIDVRLVFPELDGEKAAGPAVPSAFSHMVVDEPGAAPFCRIRLEAEWSDDGTFEGAIEQRSWWVATGDETVIDDQKQPMAAQERGLVQVHYVPAFRGAAAQLTRSAGSMAWRLLRAIDWSPDTRKSIEKATLEIGEAFGGEAAIQLINQALTSRWTELHDAPVDAEPELQVTSRQFEEVVRRVEMVFRPTEMGGERELDALSAGQKSLFYFSLVAAVFEIEKGLLEASVPPPSASAAEGGHSPNEGGEPEEQDDSSESRGKDWASRFHRELLHSPYLTVFALEEPENHLAPHYLSRIIRMVGSLTKSQMAQALFSSHSSATLNRIQPGEIRHFRLAETSRTSKVNSIKLPDSPEEEAKYVREAVVSYPEIYFSRFVVPVEGGSEQAVLPRLAQSLGLELDPSFIAIAPLGGRHVNHFWRLLSGLQIPYATLLDLDVGRNGGAWGRIKYACEQLLAVGVSRESLLRVTGGDGKESAWSEEEFQGIQDWDSLDYDGMMTWARHLEKFNVFFSGPLDLDLLMLYHFPPAYQAVAGKGQGPRIPPVGSANREEILTNAARAVLGEAGPGEVLYSGSALLSQMHDLFPWYRYLFLNKGKPSTHILALSGLNNTDLASSVPPVLQRLLSRANSQVNPGQQSIV